MKRTKRTTMKRITSILLSAIMLISSVQAVFAVTPESFTDFPTGWSRPAMESAVENGLLVGFGNNEIGPKNNLTRAEVAAVISRAFGAVNMADISAFTDVTYDKWYYNDIAKAVQMGAMSGKSATEMCPGCNVTREELFSIIARVLALSSDNTSVLSKFSDAGDVSSWAANTLAVMVERGYVNGDNLGNLNPKSYITREEFAQVMYMTIKKYITQPGTYSEDMQGIVVLRTGNVNLTNMSVESDLVVGDGAAKQMVTLTNVKINGRFLTRGGTMTLRNTTTTGGVVVFNPNGITHFNNYRTESVFNGIKEITKASFLSGSTIVGGSGGGSSTRYYVTFKLHEDDDEDYAKIRVTRGRKIGDQMPDDPTPALGYTFDGWYDEDGNEVTEDTVVRGNLTVIARFTAINYPVSYKNEDGSDFSYFIDDYTPVATFNIETQDEYEIPDETKVNRPGFTFNGWTDIEGNPITELAVTEELTVDDGIKLYASFTEIVGPTPTYYLVTFKLNAADTGYHAQISVQEGTTIGDQMPDDPTPATGYTFDGWYTEGDVEVTADTEVNSAIVAIARFTEIPVEMVEITFMADLGDGMEEYAVVEVEKNKPFGAENMPSVPQKRENPEDWVFVGWFDLSNNEFKATTVPTDNMTVYASFDEVLPDQIKVRFLDGFTSYANVIHEIVLDLVGGVAYVEDEDIPNVDSYKTPIFKKRDYMKPEYPDYDGIYEVTPTFWYETESKLIAFNSSVIFTGDKDVYDVCLGYQNFVFNANLIGLPEAALQTKYNDDSRLMDSAKVIGGNAVNWLGLARTYPKYNNIKDKAFDKLIEKDIIDDSMNIKMLYLPVNISTFATKEVANGMVKQNIRDMIFDTSKLDDLLEIADINELIRYIDKDDVIVNLTDEQIAVLMKATENRTMVKDFIITDLQSSDSALMDTVLEYISTKLSTDENLRLSVAADLKIELGKNSTSAANLRKVLLNNETTMKSVLANDAVKKDIIALVIDTESHIIDQILDDEEISKKLINALAEEESFVNEVIDTARFRNHVLLNVKKPGDLYSDVNDALNNTEVQKEIIGYVKADDKFNAALSNPVVKAKILDSIDVTYNTLGIVSDEDILNYLCDKESADYSQLIPDKDVIFKEIIPTWDTMNDVAKNFAKDQMLNGEKRGDALAAINNAVADKIDEKKNEVYNKFVLGTATEYDDAINEQLVAYVRNWLSGTTGDEELDKVIENNIIKFIGNLIATPKESVSTGMQSFKATLDASMDAFLHDPDNKEEILNTIVEFMKVPANSALIESKLNTMYSDISPIIATYVSGLSAEDDNYKKIETVVMEKSASINDSVVADVIKDNSTNTEILTILESYIADANNETTILGHVDTFIDTIDVAFVHTNRTLINDLLMRFDIEELIGSNPDGVIDLIKEYIGGLNDNQKIDLADDIYESISQTPEYITLIDHMFELDEIVIENGDIAMVMALSHAIRALTIDEAIDFTHNAYIEKIVDLLGKDFIEDRFVETRDNYCDGLDEEIEKVSSGASSYETYTTSLTFRVDPIADVLIKLYDKALPIAEEKLTNANVYYDDNEYLQYLVKHDVIDRLVTGDGVVNGDLTGYTLKSEIDYAKYVMELLIATDDAICWYGDDTNITEEQFEALYDAAFAKVQIAHEKINEILEEYMATGDLPSQLEELLNKVQRINDLFTQYEPKLRQLIDKYLAHEINDKIEDGTLADNDKVLTAVDILFGKDDPVFTIDCLYDIFYKYDDKMQAKLKELVDSGKLEKAIDKAFDKLADTSAGNRVDLDRIEALADELYAVLVNIANNGIDDYKVNTTDVKIIDKYEVTIGGNKFTITRSVE